MSHARRNTSGLIKGEVYIGKVESTAAIVSAEGGTLLRFEFNMVNFAASALGIESRKWAKWRFKEVLMRYVTGGGTGVTGSMFVFIDGNSEFPEPPIPSMPEVALTHFCAFNTAAWKDATRKWVPGDQTKWYSVQPTEAEQDYAQGVLLVVTDEALAAQLYGRIYLTYVVEFSDIGLVAETPGGSMSKVSFTDGGPGGTLTNGNEFDMLAYLRNAGTNTSDFFSPEPALVAAGTESGYYVSPGSWILNGVQSFVKSADVTMAALSDMYMKFFDQNGEEVTPTIEQAVVFTELDEIDTAGCTGITMGYDAVFTTAIPLLAELWGVWEGNTNTYSPSGQFSLMPVAAGILSGLIDGILAKNPPGLKALAGPRGVRRISINRKNLPRSKPVALRLPPKSRFRQLIVEAASGPVDPASVCSLKSSSAAKATCTCQGH